MSWGNSFIYGPKNKTSLGAVSLLLIAFMVIMVSCIIWWIRLKPWFGYITDPPNATLKPAAFYDNLVITWVIALIGAVGMIVYYIVFICCKRVGKANWVSALYVSIFALFALGFAAGTAYLAIPAGLDGAFDQDCSKKYENGISLVVSYVSEHPDLFESYSKWALKRYYKLHPNGINKPAVYHYVCLQVGYPTLFGGIFLIIGCLLLLISLLIPCCNCGKMISEDSSENQASA